MFKAQPFDVAHTPLIHKMYDIDGVMPEVVYFLINRGQCGCSKMIGAVCVDQLEFRDSAEKKDICTAEAGMVLFHSYEEAKKYLDWMAKHGHPETVKYMEIRATVIEGNGACVEGEIV